MITIKGNSGIGPSEAYLRAVAEDQSSTLVLAPDLSGLSCGGAIALLQTLVTWARRRDAPRLRILEGSAENESLARDTVKSVYGLAGILLAKEVERGSQHSEQSIRGEAYKAASELTRAMEEGRFKDTAQGPAVTLMVADHSTRRQLKPFYHPTIDGNGSLKSEKEFARLASSLLTTSVPQMRRHLISSAEQDIGILLRELIENTHRYARKDWKKHPYARSIRGLHMRTHDINNIDAIESGYKPIGDYLRATDKFERQSALQHILEISVFDSGPGFARLKLGRGFEGMDLKEEHKATQDCFLEGVSTRDDDGAGHGLGRMLLRLKQLRGFLRLRTGRTSLYKDFSRADGAWNRILQVDDYILSDALTGAAVASEMPVVEGAVLTLLLPLWREQK